MASDPVSNTTRRGPVDDMWRVDVAGCPVLVKGEPSKDFLTHVNRRMARMKMALHKIGQQRYGLDSTDTAEDQAEYWAKMANEYRALATEALKDV